MTPNTINVLFLPNDGISRSVMANKNSQAKKMVDKAGKNLLADVNDNVIVNGFTANDRKLLKYYCIKIHERKTDDRISA
jgi:phosphatidate phosphatase APP1